MPAFSRGAFLLRLQVNCSRGAQNQLHHFSFISNAGRHSSRYQFSTSTFLRAVKKAQSKVQHVLPPKPKPSSSSIPSLSKTKPTAPPVYQTFAATLAQKPNPTLLYQAPSHTLFIFSSYTAAAFFFSYAGISFYSNYLFPPPDLSTWVPIAFAGICFMMGAFGGWILLGPAGIVKSITAIPQRALTSAATTSAAAGGKKVATSIAAVSSQPELKLEVELRKMFPIPFFPARKILAKPEEVVFHHRLAAPAVNEKKLGAAELRAMRIQAEEEKRKKLEYERSHILSAPFRHASVAFYGLFRALRQTWTREGFAKIQVKGRGYKLDVSDGWALDEGRALDRLVSIKPRPGV
ncbi:hypothetical protein B7463_g4542, partial [Scytalidium lignicola]